MAIQFFLLEVAGQGAVTTNIRTVPSPMACTILEVGVRCGSPNASGDAIFDVNKNGASIFADPADRPKILSGQTSGERTGLSVSLAKDDLLSVDMDSVPLGGVAGPVFIRIKVDDGTSVEGPQGEQGDPGAPGEGVPTGGTTDQLLAKNSNTDFDTKWVDPPEPTGVPLDLPYVGTIAPGQVWMLNEDGSAYEPRTVSPLVISGEAEQDIAWSGLTGSTSVDGSNTLQTSSDWDGVHRQGARAAQPINGVGGYVKVTINGSGESTRYIGLRNNTPDHNSNNFRYFLQVRGDGTFEVWENDGGGLDNVVSGVSYSANDVIAFEAYDDAGTAKVRVTQNGTLAATFTIETIFPMFFDTELPFGGSHLRSGKIRKAA